MVCDIIDFYDKVKDSKCVISFIGNITSESINSIMQNLERSFEILQENSKIKKKIYIVFLECLQNLYHHADTIKLEDNRKIPSSFCLIYNKEDSYVIMTGNYIKNDRIKAFDNHLTKINQLSKEDLKEYYLEILNNGQKSAKDGAGLGMIDILRKSDDKLSFNFLPINTDYSLFSLNVKISK